MKRPILVILILVLFFESCDYDPQKELSIEPGVSLQLAQERAERVSAVNYDLTFTIPEKVTAPIPSVLVLSFDLKNPIEPLLLDFKEAADAVKKIKVNAVDVSIDHTNEHIILTEGLKKGANQIEIAFTAGELSLNRNEEYLYTLLVPDRARTLFPCFDQPNIKATYDLTITAPTDWEVLAGAPKLSITPEEKSTEHVFDTSDKMSTYLFSFVAGKFKTESQKRDMMEMTLLYRENDEDKIAYSRDSIFDLHIQSLNYLEKYTDFKFPFQKLDYAAIPGFQYGGMEHVGAIQYRESSLFLDETATASRVLGRAKLIAHETAHMWFGDLVTMDWFNDVWMKEVFANFMADKIVNPNFPNINHELAFMTAHYPRAYSEDRTKGTNPIRQELDNLNNAGSLYGAIIYNKAPIMMRQLELAMGEEAFQKGIQEYIATYQNDNATWPDLVSILAKQTRVMIEEWSEVWVNSSSRPIFEERLEIDTYNRIKSFTIAQKAEDGSDNIWPQTFNIDFVYDDRIETIKAAITDSTLYFPEVIGMKIPDKIIYNSNAMGYGVFPVTEGEVRSLQSIKDEVTRGYSYINTYENVLNGDIGAELVLESFRESILKEPNELLVNLLSGYINNLYWKYISKDARVEIQSKLAADLWQYVNSNIPSKIKKTIFRTFERVAYDDLSLSQLYNVWNRTTIIEDLKLNEDDYTAMANALALYGHPDSKNILNKAKQDITNPDKLSRFVFIEPTLSNDPKIKEDFFNSLKEEKNRAKESWVQAGLSNFNHPLHQKLSVDFLRPSVDLLEEVQKTGDIFFPKGWLNNTIGKHTSPKAYEILQSYITDNPNLEPSLISKLLQATDDLKRANYLNNKSLN